MKKLSRKYLKKVCGGAIMFQVLLGLGLMVIMSPMIFTQIQKYNEEIRREEVVNHLGKWQKAASSFIVFEKDQPGKIPEGIRMWEGDALKALLKDYIGGDGADIGVPIDNAFGQSYAFITNRKNDQVEAVVIAHGGDVKTLTLNGIGQFLFDSGAIMVEDGTVLSNMNVKDDGSVSDVVKLSNELETKLKSIVSQDKCGALFMFVSDAFFTSDYLHVAPMPGNSERASFVNTMIVDLNMGGNNINNVKNFYSTDVNGNNADVKAMSVSDLILGDESGGGSSTVGSFEYQNKDGIEGQTLNVKVSGSDGGVVEVDELTVENDTKFDKVFIEDGEMETKDMKLKNCYVHGDVNVKEGWNDMHINQVVANTFVSVGKRNQADTVNNIILDEPVETDGKLEESYVYVGHYSVDPEGNRTYSTDDAIVLNLAGVSEVRDICIGDDNSDCLSDRIKNYYESLENQLQNYFDLRSVDEEQI